MAGTGPAPNPASGRSAKRKKAGQGAVLTSNPDQEVPPLPDTRFWSDLTVAWWADVWASPMAGEYDTSDRHGLYALAMIVDDFWKAETARERQACSAEIRLQGVRFGLSPIDRRRLQWEIEKADEAQNKGSARRRRAAEETSSPGPKDGEPPADPRTVLHSVK